MNVTTPALLDAEVGPLTPDEAAKFAVHLSKRLFKVPEDRQAALLLEIRELVAISNPAAAFEPERYMPSSYVPGWVPDP